MYEGTSTEQKAKNAKKQIELDVQSVFISPQSPAVTAPLYCLKGAPNIFSFGVVQPTLSTV